LPYADDFSSYSPEGEAKYFADDGGSFLIAIEGTNQVLRQFVTDQAGVNAWTEDTEPISLIGPDLANILVKVDIEIGNGGADSQNIEQETCGAGESLYQAWTFESDGTVRLTGDNTSCMEVIQSMELDANVFLNDCYDHQLKSTSKAKASPTYQSWSYSSTDLHLKSAFNGQCLDVVGVSQSDGANIDTWTCVEQNNEQFTYNQSNGWLVAQHSKKCVTVVKGQIYAGLCGRIQPGEDYQRNGYCYYVYSNGNWRVAANDQKVLGSGTLGAAVTGWHSLSLSLNGNAVVATFDGKTLVNTTDNSYAKGFVSLNSGWNIASFDNFSLAPLS